MTYAEKKERNEDLFRELYERELRGEKRATIIKDLAKRHNINDNTVRRGVEAAKKVLNPKIV